MDLTTSTFTIGSIISIGMFLIALSNFFAGRRKSTKEDETRLVRIEATCARIEENTSDLKERVDRHDEILDNHGNRLTAVETKIKSNQQRR